jgi:manganese/zinc/iron transport system substrate-binding protein
MRSHLQRGALVIMYIASLLLASACGSDQAQTQGGNKVKVTATIGMITDAVRIVGGDHVEVTGLMKSGVDPHLYKASQGDIRKLDQADIVFYNGLHLEGKMAEILEKMAEKKTAVAVSDAIERELLRSGASSGIDAAYDPHIWFDVKLWMKAVGAIRDTLAEYDPEHADDYRSNAEQYLHELEQLDAEVADSIASIPEQSRVLVTAHDAFGYFGQAYNIKVMGLQGMSTASEAGAKDLIDLRDYLIENKIKAIFIESSIPRKAIDAVIEGAKEKGYDLALGGQLFSDAMGEEGTPEGTYIGMVRHNARTIAEALQ